MAREDYDRLGEWRHLFDRIRELRPRSVIFDVEPLIAHWKTDEIAIQRGVGAVLDEHLESAGVETVVFATNSWRRLPPLPEKVGPSVEYVGRARKPLRVAPYRTLPRPGVVVGDQVAGEGVLARRLGYHFIRWAPVLDSIPPGVRFVMYLNDPLARLLFRER